MYIFMRSETKEDTESDLCCYFKRNKCSLDVCPFIKEKNQIRNCNKETDYGCRFHEHTKQ